MDNPRGYANELRPGEDLATCLARQMKELGASNYWEAVHLYAERQRVTQQSGDLQTALFGFQLF